MEIMTNQQLSHLLRAIAKNLDIPQYLYEDAVAKYNDVGEWLAAKGSDLEYYDPDIYPQGSFRLGTMVRPIGAGEFDIDLVCHLKIEKGNTTQQELKDRVGKRLEERPDLKEILKSSRRCWLLDYPQQFHMDVLPAIPNVDSLPDGILLTDTELRLWQYSNPKKYADWFKDQMKIILMEKRARFAAKYAMSVEEVPEFNEELKTPLQRVVQILKRHRDIRFQNDRKNQPVSMILTTLAAKAYGNQSDLYSALVAVVTGMHNYIEKRPDGKWWVENPVDENENFADKWNEYPERREAFFEWLEQVRSDFVAIGSDVTITRMAAAWSAPLGNSVVKSASASIGYGGGETALTENTEPAVPSLGRTDHRIAPIWPTSNTNSVSIKTMVYPGSKRSRTKWPMRKSAPKNAWLRFEAKTDVKGSYKVFWQVTNTGSEASISNQLRGNSFDPSDSGNNARWEVTAFRGTHLVEAFVVQNGVCVARSGQTCVSVR